ncbi:MAG TPA: ABC transporter permease [Vicinamibacterales bacterium]|nr:ABC transporter permease [Vicinamibacterales bacterium]
MRRRWRRIAFTLALLAYPRAFRRRFGDEMRRDFTAPATSGALGTLLYNGLAERGSAIKRALFWPNDRPHLYTPSGRHHMFWDSLRSDLQHTLRLALKTPLVTALTILALALGIGATSAIFAVVDSVLLKPLPYADSDRLVNVWSDATKLGRPRNTISPANFRDFQSMNKTLDGLEAYFSFVTPFQMVADRPTEVVIGVTVTPRLFDLLGRGPMLGRTFTRDRYAFEVLLSYGFWQRRFGADPGVIGRTIQVSTYPATIVGVMPQDFTFPYGSMLGPSGFTRSTTIDLWAPMAFEGPIAGVNRMLTPQGQLVRGTHWLGAIGRIKPGTTVDQVQADLSTVARQLEQTYPETNAGWGATVVPVLEQTVGGIRGALLVLLAGVVFVLAIAAVNVANLVLARAVARQKELATRVALGAGSARMVQQAITEGLFLSLPGGLAGLLLARWGVTALVALAPADLPRVHEVAPDLRMLILTTGVSIVTGILVGLLPALTASRVAPHIALQEHSRGSVGGNFRRRARAGLVIAEVALAVTLTTGAGLLLRSFTSLLAVNPGFQPEHMLTWQMNIPARLKTQEERTAFYREFLARMRALPGVVNVGGTTRLPLGSTGLTTYLDIDGKPRPVAEWPEIQFRRAIGDYFGTMGIPLVRGRTFADSDGPSAPPVCVVNQTLAAKLFPGEDPVGKRVRFASTQPWTTIIGVIGDIKHGALDETPQPEMYVSHLQGQVVSPYMVLRTRGDAAEMVDLVRSEAQQIDRDLPVYRLQTMEAVRSDSVAQRRFVLVLVGLFGVLALSLAAIGVYGIMSLLVSERTQEVGVRLALGAQPGGVLRMLVLQAVQLALAGVAIGVGLSLALMPLLQSQLYAIDPRDPLTLGGVPTALMIVAMIAAFVPARRAMKVNPVEALRYE